jgi:uncharacterized protein YndB with AHSA1/START domain
VTLISVGCMNELTQEALVAASVDEVWRDFTDSTALAQWMWPSRFETTAVVEPEPQGAWEVRSDVADMAVLGRVMSLSPPRELRLSWRWEGEEHTTDVELTLDPAADDATRVSVHHSGFESAEERALHVEGWSNCLQRLIDRYTAP